LGRLAAGQHQATAATAQLARAKGNTVFFENVSENVFVSRAPVLSALLKKIKKHFLEIIKNIENNSRD
jgi:hypothetical protein